MVVRTLRSISECVEADLNRTFIDHRAALLAIPGTVAHIHAELPNDIRVTLDEIRRRHVVHVLDACGGNRSEAAKILGVDRKTLYRRLRRWGISP